jgi:enoyl-CoA hydratase/carnithine racemase
MNAPSPPALLAATGDGVATLTLDRADRGNALSAALVDALHDAIDRACADPAVHTIVLRGAGRHFCTGFDLSDLDESSDGDLLLRFVRIETLLAALWHAPVRTVAVVQGRTWGAGADLFAACDLRLASSDATFRFPGAGFGLVLGTRRLAERVGGDRARGWVIEGVQVDADTALATGLASKVLSPGDAWAPADARWQDRLAPPAVDRETAGRIRAATRADRRDADLAALVRSAAVPGLKARIAAYRDAVRRAAARA